MSGSDGANMQRLDPGSEDARRVAYGLCYHNLMDRVERRRFEWAIRSLKTSSSGVFGCHGDLASNVTERHLAQNESENQSYFTSPGHRGGAIRVVFIKY
jgi:hypothetical protein